MKKKITIGLFNDSFFPMADGVIMVMDNYARRLCKYANVVVFVPRYLSKKYDDSIFPYKVVRCASIKVPFLDYSVAAPIIDPGFKKELKKYKLDIIHIHSPFTIGKVGLKYAKRNHIPVIATMHSQFKQDFMRYTKNEWFAGLLNSGLIRFFNKCDECWAVNKEVARIYYEDYHYKCLPKVMNNATEMMPVENIKDAKDYINKKHNIKNNESVFLFVGRINALKNIFFIADSLKILKDKHPNLKFKMIYVGQGQDQDKLKKHIQNLGISDNVIFAGKISDRLELAKYYARADLFLFPSVYDASSIVQIEASSQKTPAVFLKGTATAATVTDGVDGFLSDYSMEKYADKVYEIISNKKLLKESSENAYKNLYKNWDDLISEVYNLYLEKIEENK